MRKIRIAYTNFSLGIGGIETLILELSKRLDRERYQPVVCAFQTDGELECEFKKEGIEVFIIKKKPGMDWIFPFRLAKFYKQQNIDIVHTHNPNPWFYGAIGAVLAGKKLVHTEHTNVDYFAYHTKRWIIIEWFLALFTDRITTVAGSVAQYMIKKQRINRNKVEVVYNGIKTDVFAVKIDKQLKRKELKVGQTDLIFGMVARFVPHKNHSCLLKAFKTVVQNEDKAKLLLAGDGPLKDDLIALAVDLKIADKVVFLGNRRDIPDLLQVFDVFVLSSLREGFPVVLLEAMAAGRPVVATDVDGNGELVVNNQTGFLVKSDDSKALADAMLKIAKDENLALNMSKAGQEKVKNNFTFEIMVGKYQDIYESVGR